MFSNDDGKSWTKPIVLAENYPLVESTLENAWDMKKWLSYPKVFEVKPGVLWITTGFGGLKIKMKERDYR